MSLKWQKILIRFVLVFTFLFCVIFLILESGSSQYRGETVFSLTIEESDADGQIYQTQELRESVMLLLESERLKQNIYGSLYERTELWKSFSLSAYNPVGTVFVLSYQDSSMDPYEVREALHVVRSEAFKILSRQYDLSREVRMRFLDDGIVVESQLSDVHMVRAFVLAFLLVTIMEGGILFYSMRKSEEEFRLVMRKRMSHRKESSEWWKNFETQPADLLKDLEKEEVIAKDKQEMIGVAPANLPIVKNITENGHRIAKEERAEDIESETLIDRETILTESPVFDDAPLVNPEPSAQELKDRLNKLLRGEL